MYRNPGAMHLAGHVRNVHNISGAVNILPLWKKVISSRQGSSLFLLNIEFASGTTGCWLIYRLYRG